MNYMNRELLAGLDTGQMLAVLGEEERQSTLETAAMVQEVLAGMQPEQRPTFSNIAMANLAYMFRMRSFKPFPLLYNNEFLRSLYQHLVREGETTFSEPLMDDIMSVADLCSPTELEAIQRGAEDVRRMGPVFEFEVFANSNKSINSGSHVLVEHKGS